MRSIFGCSPEGILAFLHCLKETTAGLEQHLKEEKDKGKISGFVDAIELKKTGDAIFDNRKAIKKYENEYRQLSGKAFSPKQCD